MDQKFKTFFFSYRNGREFASDFFFGRSPLPIMFRQNVTVIGRDRSSRANLRHAERVPRTDGRTDVLRVSSQGPLYPRRMPPPPPSSSSSTTDGGGGPCPWSLKRAFRAQTLNHGIYGSTLTKCAHSAPTVSRSLSVNTLCAFQCLFRFFFYRNFYFSNMVFGD